MVRINKTRNELHPSIVNLFGRLMPICNPSGFESGLLDAISEWLTERRIPFTSDPSWGLRFAVTPSLRHGPPPKLLLLAHLDSDPYETLEGLQSIKYDWLQDGFVWSRGRVGLDCKTGVVMCLAIAEQVLAGRLPIGLQVMFTVGEEVGQQGLLRMPESELKAMLTGVRLAVAMDRQSQYGTAVDVAGKAVKGPCVRHVVNEYCGVSLVPPTEAGKVASLLSSAAKHTRMPPLEAVVSRNCSDVLELRVRADCELVLPFLLEQTDIPKDLKKKFEGLLEKYKAATDQIKQTLEELLNQMGPGAKLGGPRSSPRIARYNVEREVFELLYGPNARKWVKSKLKGKGLSVLNMSYDYMEPEDGESGFCSIGELMTTCRLTLSMLAHMPQHFAN